MANVFDTNDIRTTGLTVEGRAVISGASNTIILEVTGASGTNLQVIDDPASDLIWSLSGTSGYLFDVYEDRIDTSVPINSSGTTTFQPSHWEKLVDFNTITIHFTSVGKNADYWVREITNEYFQIGTSTDEIDCFYIVHAERIDVPKITVIYKPL